MTRAASLAVLGLSAVLVFWDLGGRPLYAPDEGRYAAIGLELVASGDWLVPRLSGVPYLDKPPLLYWLEALGILLLGRNEWGVRLLPALATWLAVPLVMRLGRELYDRRSGVAAAAILASCVLWIGVARVLLTDGILASAVLGAFLCFWRACEGRSGALGLWLCLALATLAKGPIGPALFGLAALPFWWLARPRPSLTRLRPIAGGLVYSAIALPWFLLVEREIPGYASYFFLNQNLEALASEGIHHAAPWYSAFLLVAAGFAPWSAVAPLGLARLRRVVGPARAPLSRETLLLVCWVATTFAVFTISVSKLVTYYLPMYAALSLLVARLLLQPGSARPAGATLLALGLLAPAAGWLLLARAVSLPLVCWLSLALLLTGAGLAAGGLLLARGRTLAGCLAVPLCLALAVLAATRDLDRVNGLRSARALIEASAETLARCDVLISARFPSGMLEFYLARPVVLVDTARDYVAGRALAPQAGAFVAARELGAFLDANPRACIFSHPGRAEQMLAAHPRLRVARRGPRYALLTTAESAPPEAANEGGRPDS